MALLNASEYGKQAHDNLYLGRIYRAVSGVYTDTWNTEKALGYAHEAHNCFLNTDNEPLKIWSLLDIARCHYNHRNYVESINIADSCIRLAKQTDDDQLYYQSLKIKGSAQIQNNDARNGITTLKQLGLHTEGQDAYLIALGYHYIGVPDSVEYYNSLSNRLGGACPDQSGHQYLRFELDRANGDYLSAMEYLDSLYNNQVTVMWGMVGKNIANTESDFFENQAILKDLEIRQHKMWIVFIAVILLMSVVFFILFHRKQKENLLLRIKTYVQKAENLQNELQEKYVPKDRLTSVNSRLAALEQTNQNLIEAKKELEQSYIKLEQTNQQIEQSYRELENTQKEEIRGLLRNELSSRLETINKLGKILFVSTNSDSQALDATREKAVMKKILQIVNEINVSRKTVAKLEGIVNNVFDDAISILKKQLPDLYNKYGRLYLFKALSLSNDTIAYLMKTSNKKVYNDCFRCKEKIRMSGCPETEILLRPLKLIGK